MKIRTRLFLMLLVTSLVPLLLFSCLSVASFISNSEKSTYQLNEGKLKTAATEINGMIDKYIDTLHIIVSQPAVRNFDLTGTKEILVNAANVVNSDLNLALSNSEGQQLVKNNDDGLTNVSQREFFQKAMSGVEEYVSDILVSKVTGELVVVFSAPVRDMNNNIAGVLQASIGLSKVSDFVTELSEGGAEVYVLSRQGTVLAHPNKEYVQNQEDFSALEYVQTGLTGQNMTVRSTNIKGEEVIVSHYLDELSGWLIVVETPVSAAMASVYSLLYVTTVILIVAAVIIGLLGLYFSKRFTKPLLGLTSTIGTIAEGNLQEFEMKVSSATEIGQLYKSLKTMTHNLRELVGNIQTVASTLASHSVQLTTTTDEATQSLTQVVATINEMAEGNTNQAAMVQSATNAIARVDMIVSEAAEKTEIAADKAKYSLELANEGKKALERQSQKIEENNRYTNIAGESIHQLATMANEIGNIVGVINGIAEQTNLLALNASIEAARAGDAGRGFAVVAEEIRKLAEQSRNSTGKIYEIVNAINGKINETVNHMNQVSESVLVMGASAEDTKESFGRIFASINEMAQIAYDVSVALTEINNQTKEVTSQAMNISAVVEETSAGMEEISASSEEQLASVETIAQSSEQLKNIAQELITLVEKFTV